MPDIAPIGPSIGAASTASIHRSTPVRQSESSARPTIDRVDLSDHARHLERLRTMPDVREEKVQSIRASIERGTYETPERMQAALRRLLDDLTA